MPDPHQLCLETSYLEDLKRSLDVVDINEVYGATSFSLDQKRLKITPITLAGPAPDLVGEKGTTGPSDDAKNAILLHRWMPGMSSAQGGDPRLWTYLTHSHFWSYARSRWGIEGGKSQVRHILNRWFLRGGRQGLNSNAVARLWWGAHLTYAPWVVDPLYFSTIERDDEYALTRRIFSQQNMFQGLVSRRFGSSFRVRVCLLEAFERLASSHSNLSALSEDVEKKVNLVCSYRVLSALPFEKLMALMERHVSVSLEEARRPQSK